MILVKPNIPSLSEYLPKLWLNIPTKDKVNQLPTINQIKEKLIEYEETYEVDRESLLPPAIRKAQNADFRHNDSNLFIATKTTNANSFKPNITKKHFLYRGQREFYTTCKPVVYRDSTIKNLIENIRRAEFEILLESHPLYRLLNKGIQLCNKVKLQINNPYGLAQHYGFKTALLDLTSDFEIASFFGTTKHDANTDTYSPYLNSTDFGVIYVYHMTQPFSVLTYIDGLSTIGLQPFSRPGKQKGFLWTPSKNSKTKDFHESPYITKVFFKHDPNINKAIFEKMKQGKILFPDDELAQKSRLILSSTTFSLDAFERNWKRNNPNDDPYRNMSLLQREGISIDSSQKPIIFSKKDLDYYYERIQNRDWIDFCSQIIFPHDPDNILKSELISIKDKPEYYKFFHKTL
jgi:hypothetical protein